MKPILGWLFGKKTKILARETSARFRAHVRLKFFSRSDFLSHILEFCRAETKHPVLCQVEGQREVREGLLTPVLRHLLNNKLDDGFRLWSLSQVQDRSVNCFGKMNCLKFIGYGSGLYFRYGPDFSISTQLRLDICQNLNLLKAVDKRRHKCFCFESVTVRSDKYKF